MRIPRPNPALTLVLVLWGYNFVSLKLLYREVSPPAVSLLRYSIMAVLLVAICLVRGEPLMYGKDRWRILGFGFLSMGIYMVLFLEGLSRTAPAEGAIVLATTSVFTYLIASAVGHERFRPLGLAGALVAFLGVAIVISAGSSSGKGSVAGDLLVLGSSLLWATSAIVTKPLVARYSPLSLFTLSLPGALPVLIPYGGAALIHQNFHLSSTAWLNLLQAAVLSGVIAHSCFYLGVKQVGAARATGYQFFVPPTAAVFSWWVLGKPLALAQVLGLCVLLAGATASFRARGSAVQNEPSMVPVGSES